MFTGFPVAALDFYEDLEADNSKPFWAAHKAVYDDCVRGPMLALLAELEPEFGAGKAFRPHRDVRFSTDKSPYKTHQGGFVQTGPGVGFYVQIDAAGMRVAGGFYRGSSDQVAAYRAAVDDSRRGPRLEPLVRRLHRAGYEIGGERLKTRPRGVAEDHPRLDLLRHKSLTAARAHPSPEWIDTPRTLDEVRSAWRDVRPLVEWLTAATAT
ncbi:hypothetical protein D092_02330 [Rhodococcus ruber Chol-4]|uniref:TIGR02453 family protein n=1 Tax=Rhodococcus ruber TaxID=1830 RepID=A0A098BRG5_9NOCA|nr:MULTISPECIES: DUF2461 domain-containing protein [Rhodococcus]KXF87924.1 hypothetical protein D092_02330 [Rhodococcus ruber Chol-4]MCD2126827.1 DUF2461 domain-containing protein [Rhodococcus ruber]MCZ4503706.1 DUF2461 domain-containing protein [Rhodococcus ruber]MCZ4532180.1 DUF2461 domain-containing protein [Rhodococcus ruber]MCZ4619249.1 DUF2461 domain-containing protein [Rhodococcus ruber]